MISAMTAALDAASRRIPNLWDHLGLIITLLAGAIVLIRLLAAADWDQQLAMAILQASGTGNVLVGAVLSTLPHVLGMSLVLVLVAGRVPYQLFRHQRRPSVWDVSQLVLIVLVMALTSWTYYLILLVAALILGIVLGINDRTTPTTGRNSNVRLIASLLVVPTLSALLFSNTPWMARESLEFRSPRPHTSVMFCRPATTR